MAVLIDAAAITSLLAALSVTAIRLHDGLVSVFFV